MHRSALALVAVVALAGCLGGLPGTGADGPAATTPADDATTLETTDRSTSAGPITTTTGTDAGPTSDTPTVPTTRAVPDDPNATELARRALGREEARALAAARAVEGVVDYGLGGVAGTTATVVQHGPERTEVVVQVGSWHSTDRKHADLVSYSRYVYDGTWTRTELNGSAYDDAVDGTSVVTVRSP